MHRKLHISDRTFAKVQAGCVGFLVLAGLGAYLVKHLTGHGRLMGLIPLLDLGNEAGAATFFSALNLLLAALLTYLFSHAPDNAAGSRRWRLLSGVFVYLAFDEAMVLHENLSLLYPFVTDSGALIGERHGWLLFGGIFAAAAGFAFAPLLLSLRRGLMMLVACSATLFAVGAIGFEFIGSLMIRSGISPDSLLYDVRRVVEEGLEMAGIAIYNWALVREMSKAPVALTLTLNTAEPRH